MARSNVNGSRDAPGNTTHTAPVATGEIVCVGGRTARVETFSRTPLGVFEVLLDHGDRLERVPWAEFAARAMTPRPVSATLAAPASALFGDLDQDVQDRIRERHCDLRQVLCGSRSGNPDRDRELRMLDPDYDPLLTTPASRLKKKVRELKARQSKPYSRAQVYRQLLAVERDGIDGLIHASVKSATSKLARFDPADVEAIREYLAEEHPEGTPAHKILHAKVRSSLDQQGLGGTLTHYGLRQAVSELSRGMGKHHQAKGRQSHHIKPVRPHGYRAVSAPAEMVQVDATATNIPIFDPDAGWVPATILTAIDVHTRCVLALSVFVGAATGRHTRSLIWRMTQPNVRRSGYPYALTHWMGIPRLLRLVDRPDVDTWLEERREVIGTKPAMWPTTIAVDRGGENNNVSVIEACARVGIDIVFVPPGAGYAKGIVESIQAEWDSVASLFGSYKGANPLNHPKGVEAQAVLTAPDLEDILWTHVLGTYHHRPHEGLGRDFDTKEHLTPATVLEGYLEHGGAIYMPEDPMRYVTLLATARRKVGDDGIHMNGHLYNSADVVELRQHLQRGVGAPAREITVFADEYDVTKIFLRHPVSAQWLCVPKVQHGAEAESPYSDLIRRTVLDNARASGNILSSAEVSQHMADLRTRWDHGIYTDRRDERRAALERDRQRTLAQDIEEAGEDFRALAYRTDRPAAEAVPEYASLDADEDELFAYDEIEPDELAL